MTEFDESDLRPFTGLQRPMTGKAEDDIQPLRPARNQTASRPMTTVGRPSAKMAASRPVTSSTSGRPTTGSVPDWVLNETDYGTNRPKTGYRQDGTTASEVNDIQLQLRKYASQVGDSNVVSVHVVLYRSPSIVQLIVSIADTELVRKCQLVFTWVT